MKGLAIGNGWVDPAIQYTQYADFAYDNQLIKHAEYVALNASGIVCRDLIKAKLWPIAIIECNLIMSTILEQTHLNPYDIRKKCGSSPLCYDFNALTKFINQPSVRKELGIGNRKWTPCSSAVYLFLIGEWSSNFATVVPELLDANYTVLVYSGMMDLICNYYGGREWLRNMEWQGQTGFNNAQYRDWIVNGKFAGKAKSFKNLIFLEVADAGHMVPMDQPKNALDLINRLISNTPF